MQSSANFKWLTELFAALLSEYTHRYKRVHKYQRFLKTFSQYVERIAPGPLTPWAQAMPAFMQLLKKEYAGQYDGKTASEIARNIFK
jgi:hypothetical protein